MAIDQKLINELKKLSKRANQRILEIERLTKRKSPQFAVKELGDYLSVTGGLTKRKGKSIRASQYKKSMTETDVVGSIKALKNFLESPGSSIKKIKSYTKKASESGGKKLSYAQASKLYQAEKNWQWIFEYVDESEFWSYYNTVFKKQKPSYEQFIEDLESALWQGEIPIDEDLKKDLVAVYNYLRS